MPALCGYLLHPQLWGDLPMLPLALGATACESLCPHDAPALLCPEHQCLGTPHPPASPQAWSSPGRPPGPQGQTQPVLGNDQLLPKGMQTPMSLVAALLQEEQQQLMRKRN